MNQDTPEATALLRASRQGDEHASRRLLALLYEELRELARRKLAREPAGQTLQATALVHEVYLRLVKDDDARWDHRGHFFGAAAEAMRRILIERARAKGRIKRGGRHERVALDEGAARTAPAQTADLLALDEALTRLEAIDARKAQIVKLRFFAGLSLEETAAALERAPSTVKSDWAYARAWLGRELAEK